ncbi:MAG: hypothetical protein ACHQHP_01290 [Bacteroidia bacterium]
MITPIFRFLFCLLPTAYCLLFYSTSCKQKTDYSKEISRLDSASTVLITAEKILSSADTNLLHSSYNSVAGNLHAVIEKLSKDTVKKKTAEFLSSAYQQSGNILNLLQNKNYLEKAITESQKRINDLKHDLNENLIDKNKSAAYIVSEINSSGKIYDIINKSVERAKSSAAKLDSLKTKISAIADSLKGK